jgi:hypothetical protein
VTESQHRDKHKVAKAHSGTKVSIAKQAGLASGKRRAALATGKDRMISILPEFHGPG